MPLSFFRFVTEAFSLIGKDFFLLDNFLAFYSALESFDFTEKFLQDFKSVRKNFDFIEIELSLKIGFAIYSQFPTLFLAISVIWPGN